MNIDRIILSLNRMEVNAASMRNRIDARAVLLVTVVYLVAMLGVPLAQPQRLVWFAVYPIVSAEAGGVGYRRVFVKSLYVLPLVAMIGIFNPIVQTSTAFTIAGVGISEGWVSFITIVLRGLLAMQVALTLMYNTGYYAVCTAVRRLGCPKVLVVQLLMVYRYMTVLLTEAQAMDRARRARGFGRRHYPLRQWSVLVGQLLMRSIDRARRIHRAMLARGFDGTMPIGSVTAGRTIPTAIYALVWITIIITLRIVDVPHLITTLR